MLSTIISKELSEFDKEFCGWHDSEDEERIKSFLSAAITRSLAEVVKGLQDSVPERLTVEKCNPPNPSCDCCQRNAGRQEGYGECRSTMLEELTRLMKG